MNTNGYSDIAMSAGEALYNHFSWIVLVSEAFMLLPFLYWFWLQFTKKTVYPKAFSFTNILIIYAVFYIIKVTVARFTVSYRVCERAYERKYGYLVFSSIFVRNKESKIGSKDLRVLINFYCKNNVVID